MTDTTPRAGAPLLAAAQAQKHVTHNDALYQFDAFLCTRFVDRDLSNPPSSPTDGDTYLVKATGTGLWAGQDGKIAYCADGAWRFYAPFAGLVAFVADESALIVFNGASWVSYASLIALQDVPLLGVNATADSTNKLSVQSNIVLFSDVPTGSGGSGDMRVTLSKQASGNTASLLMQDNFSGRAEIGLAGDDNFHFKVSPDGSSWADALQINATTGQVSAGLGIAGPASLSVPRWLLEAPANSNGSITTPQEILRLRWHEGSQDLNPGEGLAINWTSLLVGGTEPALAQIASYKESGTDTNSQTSLKLATTNSAGTLTTGITLDSSQNLTLAGLFIGSAATSLTAHAGGGQSSALAITASVNAITTVATAADSVKLPASVAGLEITVINAGANACQVFGTGSDTINTAASGTGVSLAAGKTAIYACPVAGKWYGGALS